jgi:hypothetical protein
MLQKILFILLALFSSTLVAQSFDKDLDSTINTLIESGMKKYPDLKGDSTAVLSDPYFKQYNSKLPIKGFKYSLITHYAAGKMLFFTGVFLQAPSLKKALAAYKLLADRIELVKVTCCTLKREPGNDLENEKSTYYKPFARTNAYKNLELIVALESAPQKKGKLLYNVILYIYPNPLK